MESVIPIGSRLIVVVVGGFFSGERRTTRCGSVDDFWLRAHAKHSNSKGNLRISAAISPKGKNSRINKVSRTRNLRKRGREESKKRTRRG
jgi:hypothetical protein